MLDGVLTGPGARAPVSPLAFRGGGPRFGKAASSGNGPEDPPADRFESQHTEETAAPETETKAGKTRQEKIGWRFWKTDTYRIGAGIFFKHVLPLLMGFPIFAGPLGWAVAIAGIPIAYASGRYGASLLKAVEGKPGSGASGKLNFLDHLHRFEQAASNPDAANPGEIRDSWNAVIDSFLDVAGVRRGRGLVKEVVGWAANRMKMSDTNWLGRMVTRYSFWRANVYYGAAQAENGRQLFRDTGKNLWERFLFTRLLPSVGNFVKRVPGLRWLGWVLEKLGWLFFFKSFIPGNDPASQPNKA